MSSIMYLHMGRKEWLHLVFNKICVNFSMLLIDSVILIGLDSKPTTPE